jgi:hypothetical protein
MRTGEIKFQKAVIARGFQGPRQQPLCRLTDGQIRDEDRRLQSADAKACGRHLAHLHRHHGCSRPDPIARFEQQHIHAGLDKDGSCVHYRTFTITQRLVAFQRCLAKLAAFLPPFRGPS